MERCRPARCRSARAFTLVEQHGFTLVELLVVVLIVLLVSAATLPSIITAVSHRSISEAARILQGQLVQARDTAIRFNAPRGVRFLPDPTYANSATILAYNRMVPIEPGPEYANGSVVVWPIPTAAGSQAQTLTAGLPAPNTWQSPVYWPAAAKAGAFPPPYPVATPASGGVTLPPVYPYWPQVAVPQSVVGQALMIEQAPFIGNDPAQGVNAPTSWYWNIRIGERIQFNNQGQTYTIVGPMLQSNPELFVNVGQPGDVSGYLQRQYTTSPTANNPNPQPVTVPVEYLILVNGKDDSGAGWVDSGWDGIVNYGMWAPPNTTTPPDTLWEWQNETWQGSLANFGAVSMNNVAYNAAVTNSPGAVSTGQLSPPLPYTISRRPVPSQSARETLLPSNVVVDATSWNATRERSRLPVDPFSHYVDILLLPNGQVVPTTLYSAPTSFGLTSSFYHFWLSERQDVHEAGDLWGYSAPGAPNPNPNTGMSFLLPLPQDPVTAYTTSGGTWTTLPTSFLTGERMLVTLFSRTGELSNSSIEYTGIAANPGWSVTDVSAPFYPSQLGVREGK